ncbi:hypothetical protein BDV93DRAFT_366306 [Ceratobasidium sp. AG-I]|nr:hypothetical protein BDV93DRAFT_366306 [Ceratobasidium sp. AG-I]
MPEPSGSTPLSITHHISPAPSFLPYPPIPILSSLGASISSAVIKTALVIRLCYCLSSSPLFGQSLLNYRETIYLGIIAGCSVAPGRSEVEEPNRSPYGQLGSDLSARYIYLLRGFLHNQRVTKHFCPDRACQLRLLTIEVSRAGYPRIGTLANRLYFKTVIIEGSDAGSALSAFLRSRESNAGWRKRGNGVPGLGA